MEYALAHITARLLGEEPADHPRQRAIRWLLGNGRGSHLAEFNYRYSLVEPTIRECFPHVAVQRAAMCVIHDGAIVADLCHDRPHTRGPSGAGAPGVGAAPPAGVHPQDQHPLPSGVGA